MIAQHSRAEELFVAAKLDGADSYVPPVRYVEDNLGVARLIALKQLARGEGPTIFVQATDDLLASAAIDDWVHRLATLQVRYRLQVFDLEMKAAFVRCHCCTDQYRTDSGSQ